MKSRILLTTVYSPYECTRDGDNLMDPYRSRFGREQGVFSHRGQVPYFANDYIAANIDADTTVLENPTLEDFIEELKTRYDFVGIGFQGLNIERAFEMAAHAKRYHPGSSVIFGGYGVLCMGRYIEQHPEFNDLVDHVCREDGVTFFRKLLRQPEDGPVDRIMPLSWLYPFRLKKLAMPIGVVLGSLGCERKCEFCSTSALHGGSIRVSSAVEMYNTIKRYLYIYPDLYYINIYEEDLLFDRKHFTEFFRLLQQDGELMRRVAIQFLATVDGLSRIDLSDLVRMGTGAVWIGVESTFSSMSKLRGSDMAELFERLHRHGISTTASFIVGLDCQNAENIADDIENLVKLGPTMSQVTSLIPSPGTKLWDRLQSESRILEVPWTEQHGGGENILHPGFAGRDIHRWIRYAYKKLFHEHGSSSLRGARVALNGLRFTRQHPDAALRNRSIYYDRLCRRLYPTLPGHLVFAPNGRVRKLTAGLYTEYRKELGPLTCVQWISAVLMVFWFFRNFLVDLFDLEDKVTVEKKKTRYRK